MAELNTDARKKLPAKDFAEKARLSHRGQGARPQRQGPRKSGRQGRPDVEGRRGKDRQEGGRHSQKGLRNGRPLGV
jgi:hypothetical protein